jgi:hypothetical protein
MKRVALIAALVCSGCSMTLPVQGQVQSTGESFSGSATGHIDGAGTLTINSNKGASCTGNFVYVTMREGSGTFHCSDGRSGPFTFVSTGKRGTGKGTLDGQPFIFTFGK